MPPLRKRKLRKNDDENQDREEFVIPTPSIDQVLQNLASNALEIASGGSKSDDDEQGINGNESIEQQVEPDLRRSKRKQNLTTQPCKVRIISTKNLETSSLPRKTNGRFLPMRNSKRIANLRASTENSNAESSSSKVAPVAFSTNSMLDELVSRSVQNKETTVAVSTTSSVQNNNNSFANLNQTIIRPAMVQPPNVNYKLPPQLGISGVGPSISALAQRQQIYQNVNNPSIRNILQQNNYVDPRIESTVDQVVSSLRKSVRDEAASSKLQERTQHFVIRQLTNNQPRDANNIISSQEPQPPITIEESSEDNNNDDVQIVDDDDEEDEGETTPFCKNCANEIPLIIKRLDKLDNMVNRIVTMVRKELRSPDAVANKY